MSDRPAPETDALDCELHTPRVLQDRYSEMRDHAQKLERERDEAREKAERYRLEANSLMLQRDEARESLKHIGEYGTEEINAAIDLRQKLASALVKYDTLATEHMLVVNKLCKERDDAQSEIQRLRFDAQREAEHYDRMVGELEKVYTERDDALEKIKELIYIADRAIDLADIDFENDKFGVVSELRSDLEKIKKQNYHSDKMSSFVSVSSK